MVRKLLAGLMTAEIEARYLFVTKAYIVLVPDPDAAPGEPSHGILAGFSRNEDADRLVSQTEGAFKQKVFVVGKPRPPKRPV